MITNMDPKKNIENQGTNDVWSVITALVEESEKAEDEIRKLKAWGLKAYLTLAFLIIVLFIISNLEHLV